MTIAKITDAYFRDYRDSGQSMFYVEWVDDRGNHGRTEGPTRKSVTGVTFAGADDPRFGWHMCALLNRAKREGIEVRRETW